MPQSYRIDTDYIAELIGNTNIRVAEPMSLHTTFRIGGIADVFVTPSSAKALLELMKYILKQGIPYFVIGKGSNLIITDKGFRGIVISNKKLNRITYKGRFVNVGSGTSLKTISEATARHNLSGLEFVCGIPGSVGGAVYMNSGAYEMEISKVVYTSKVIVCGGKNTNDNSPYLKTLTNAEHLFSYRHSVLQDSPFIHVASTFLLNTDKSKDILKRIKEYNSTRAEKQPLEMPSAGSVFKRPQGFFSGKLIQDSGLKGFRIGDAMVSDKHCGFIVNLGKASAADVLSLIEHIQSTVYARFGIMLQPEVRIIGEK